VNLLKVLLDFDNLTIPFRIGRVELVAYIPHLSKIVCEHLRICILAAFEVDFNVSEVDKISPNFVELGMIRVQWIKE
jgi:hypothetical protein